LIHKIKIFIDMTPEEFYYMEKIKGRSLFEMRVRSLGWVLDCFRKGKIRKRTLKNLIPEQELEYLLLQLQDDERYEDCAVVRDILKEIYN